MLPGAATAGNPLDYTSLLWDEPELLEALVRGARRRPARRRACWCSTTSPTDSTAPPRTPGPPCSTPSAAPRGSIDTPVAVASTLPELLADRVARPLIDDGLVAVAGLRTGVRVVGALGGPRAGRRRGSPRCGAAAARAARAPRRRRVWLAEHEAKALLAAPGIAVPEGRLVDDADDAAACQAALGGPVAMKLTSPDLRHKSELGAFELNVDSPEAARAAYARLRALDAVAGARCSSSAWPRPGAELLVSARADAVVPALVVGLGGVWTEALGDVAVIPLPGERRARRAGAARPARRARC